MDNASHAYDGSTIFFDLPEPHTMLDGGNSAFLSNGMMVRRKEDANGNVYWTNDFREEGFAAYAAEVIRQMSEDPDHGETFQTGSVPSQGYSDVAGWLANSGQEPSHFHQEAPALYGYPGDPYDTPMFGDGNASLTGYSHAQGFEQQSFYGDEQVGSIYQEGESSQVVPPAIKWTDRVSSSEQQELSAGDGMYVELPPAPDKPNPMKIPYCSLQSHAQYLVSDAGPSSMGIRGRSLEFAEEKLSSMHDVYGGPKVIRWYGKWAAEQAGVEYKPICQQCYIAHRNYFFKGGKYEGTCYCNPGPSEMENKM